MVGVCSYGFSSIPKIKKEYALKVGKKFPSLLLVSKDGFVNSDLMNRKNIN